MEVALGEGLQIPRGGGEQARDLLREQALPFLCSLVFQQGWAEVSFPGDSP